MAKSRKRVPKHISSYEEWFEIRVKPIETDSQGGYRCYKPSPRDYRINGESVRLDEFIRRYDVAFPATPLREIAERNHWV